MPKIEYTLQSENFTFIKTLSIQDVQQFLQANFFDWHLMALETLEQQDKFKQHLLDITNKINCGFNIKSNRYGKTGQMSEPQPLDIRNNRLSLKKRAKLLEKVRCCHSYVPGQCNHKQILIEREAERLEEMGYNPEDFGIQIGEKKDVKPKIEDMTYESSYLSKNESQISSSTAQRDGLQCCIFEMREKNYKISDTEHVVQKNIHKYNSLDNYNEFWLKNENIANLQGCFEKDNNVGQIQLSTFNISIKSLVTSFSYSKNLTLNQWEDISGFFKKQAFENQSQPEQLIDQIVKVFEKKAYKDDQDKFDLNKNIDIASYRSYFNSVQSMMRSQTLDKDVQTDVLAMQALKKKIRVVQTDFMKLQNKSKLITVVPIFNQKQYLGLKTEPLPVERYLVEITFPQA